MFWVSPECLVFLEAEMEMILIIFFHTAFFSFYNFKQLYQMLIKIRVLCVCHLHLILSAIKNKLLN